MSVKISRRELLKTAAVGTGALAASRLAGYPYIMAQQPASGDQAPLRLAVIGCGGQGTNAHVPVAARQNLVALIDPDTKALESAITKAKAEKEFDADKVRTFSDYRVFFDQMAKEVDAVIIVTPNHQHALPSLLAMQRGIGVYVEKPMAYDIREANLMAETARKYKVATQMGNEGHSGEGYRRLCEYLWAGAIGNVTEVYHWTNRANGGVGPRPPVQPVPANLDWDKWVGPAPYRDFHADLHPHSWHGWLGNMAAHVMDGAFWALDLARPSAIEVEQMVGGSAERYPVGTRIRWDYPARPATANHGPMPPVKLWWYDGKRADVADAGKGDGPASVSREAANKPPIMLEMEKLTGRNFGDSATFYIGDKGIMYTGTYGGGVRILPEEKHKAFPVPPIVIPRVGMSHHRDFFRAVRGGQPAVSNFDYAAPFTEVILLGDLAIKAGQGRKIEWDADKKQVTNLPEMNRFVGRPYRKGWEY
jgi:predicted dehydrogenase